MADDLIPCTAKESSKGKVEEQSWLFFEVDTNYIVREGGDKHGL